MSQKLLKMCSLYYLFILNEYFVLLEIYIKIFLFLISFIIF